MKHLVLRFIQSILSGIGSLWLFVQIYDHFNSETQLNWKFWEFISLSVLLGVLFYIFDGIFFTGYLKQRIKISSNAFDTIVTVRFGNIFKKDGCIAIPVNDFFDSNVDDKHISSSSLHGIMLERYWRNNLSNWDQQISMDLKGVECEEVSARRFSEGKITRYKIGTTAEVSIDKKHFLCTALSRTDANTLESHTTMNDYFSAIRGLLKKSRTVCSGKPLNIPLFGSGLSRTGVKPNILIHLILIVIFEESRNRKITESINIILPRRFFSKINLATIGQDWR